LAISGQFQFEICHCGVGLTLNRKVGYTERTFLKNEPNHIKILIAAIYKGLFTWILDSSDPWTLTALRGIAMSKPIKHQLLLAVIVVLVTGTLIITLRDGGFLDRMRQRIRSDLLTENARLESKIKALEKQIAQLSEQNRHLKKALVGRTFRFSILEQILPVVDVEGAGNRQSPSNTLSVESMLIRQIYQALLAEKERWDTYQQNQYQTILAGTLEPIIVESEYLDFVDGKSRDLFLEIENTLHLHRRLIRDIRLFHDEVNYRNKRIQEEPSYELFDLKLNLEPFARESAITDALQQSLSALGAGIYQTEAAETLERLGGIFVAPIEALSDWLASADDTSGPKPYNYNFYIVFGKKLIDYADSLAGQTMIPLAPSALGELDYFSRRIGQSLIQLHEAGSQSQIDDSILDMEVLEREMQ
jgi:hypothetical protein